MTAVEQADMPVVIEGAVIASRKRGRGAVPTVLPAVLPALRSDLAPLVPTMRRAATVIAAAAVVELALRAGPQAVLRQGRRVVRGRASGQRASGPRQETLIVERVIVQRTY
ncbi:MAG: hypothetical protein DK306_001188 [Chloroflexi bacterium]|nr:MAG: hypothetical protein DK306_001188 [Chloroflexota bacterium]